jgi:hypothetical protein
MQNQRQTTSSTSMDFGSTPPTGAKKTNPNLARKRYPKIGQIDN